MKHAPEEGARIIQPPLRARGSAGLATLVAETAEPIDDIETASVDAIIGRIGDARLVLLGEATHGTSEFYRMRARITRELIARRGFQFVAVEADWPDAARIDDDVLGGPRRSKLEFAPFDRFPKWMWRNEEVGVFVDWLRAYNADRPVQKVSFHGLDLYSLFTSIAVVLAYLDDVDPDAARVARRRYGTLTPQAERSRSQSSGLARPALHKFPALNRDLRNDVGDTVRLALVVVMPRRRMGVRW